VSVAKKEAKRLELAAKKAAKASKAAVTDAVIPEKKKEKEKPEKAKKEEDAPFVNTTPKGHKKGMCVCDLCWMCDILRPRFVAFLLFCLYSPRPALSF